jgi:hypothetical protein
MPFKNTKSIRVRKATRDKVREAKDSAGMTYGEWLQMAVEELHEEND